MQSIPSENQSPDLIRLSTLVYGILLGAGLTIMHFQLGGPKALLQAFWPILNFHKFLLTIVLAITSLLMLSMWLEQQFPSYHAVKRSFADMFSHCSIPTLFYLSVISGVAEEVFFRGALVPLVGVIPSAIFFAIVHVGPQGRFSLWTLWAGMAGILFGFMFESQQSLLAVIVVHILINFISFLSIKKLKVS